MHPLEEKAKETFGIDYTYHVPKWDDVGSAFILSDGTWLRRGRGKWLSHDGMAEQIIGRGCGSRCLPTFMSKTGAIRVLLNMSEGRLGLDIPYTTQTPSSEQMEAIHEYCGMDGTPEIKGYPRCYGYVSRGDVLSRNCGRFEGGLRELANTLVRCRV